MKEMSNITKTSVMVPRWYRVKSRIDSIRPVLTMLALLMVALLGVNESAWASLTHTGKTAVRAGKGKVTVKIHYRVTALTGDDAHTGKSASTTDSSLVEATYSRGNSQDGSIAFYAEETVTGYTFSGWYENPDCSGTPVSTSKTYWAERRTKSNGVTKIAYAKFTPTDVTFNANGGSVATSSKTVTDGSTYGTLPVPTRSNYTFLNWYTGASDGTVVTSLTTVTNKINHSLYAHWTPNYTITLNAGDGVSSTGTTSITAALNLNNNLTSAITTPRKDGNVFDGYYTGTGGTGTQIIDAFGNVLASKSDASYTYTDASKNWKYAGNITLYAYWRSKYTPEFDFVGNTTMKVGEVQNDVFDFTHVPVPVATILVVSIDAKQDANYSGTVIEYSDNKIYARNAGTAKLVIDQADNDTIHAGHSDTVTITVQKWPSSIDGTLGASNLMVEGGTSIGSYTTSNVEAGDPAEGDSNDYYYTISHSLPDGATTTGCATGHSSHVIGFNPSTKAITAYNAGTARLTITQKETYRYTGATKSFDVTVHKYNNSFSATANYNKKVDETQASDYVWTYAKPDAAYPGDADHNAGTPGKGSESGNFYYTIDHEFPEDAITTGCPVAYVDSIITYVASTKTATARNAGRATVTLHQKETFKYKAASNSFTVTVTKWDNPLDVVGNSAHWAANIYPDRTWENKELRSTYNNADYTTFPISVVQYAGNTPGKEIMTYEYNQSTRKITFHSNYRLGTAKWRFTQPESYKYLAGEDSIRLTVIHAPEATDCYVKTDLNTEHEFRDGSWEMTWNDENAAGRLTFEAKAEAAWTYGLNVFQYINGSWNTVEAKYFSHDELHTSYHPYGFDLDPRAKGVKFERTGTLRRWIKNVYVSRKTYLEAADTIRIAKTADLNPVYPSDMAGAGMFEISYSVANGSDLKIVNDNLSKFTLSQTVVEDVDCSTGSETINVSYTPNAARNDTAHLIIYNDVYRDTVVLIGTCVKHHQAGSWKENIETLPKGVKVGNAYTSTTSGTHGVTYRVIIGTSVTVDGDTLIASTSGKSTVVAEVAEDDMYYAIADTIEIEVTNDLVQYIVWNQDYELAHLEEDGANVVLNAYADSETESCSTNGAYSEHARPITYSIEGGGTSVVQIVNGNELQINGAGTAYVRAMQAGGTDYDGHSYASTYMRKKVVVRGPNDPCGEYYLYNLNDSTQWKTDDASKLRQEPVNGEDILFEGKGNKTRYSNTFSFAPAYAILYAKKEKGGGSATIEQYIPGEGWTSTGYSRTTFNNGSDGWPSAPDTISLSRNATQVRAVLSQSSNYIYMGGLKVVIAEFAAIAEDAVEKDTLVFSANVKTRQSKDVAVHRYSKDALFLSLPENAPFTLNKEDISKNCRPDTTDLRITFNPDVAMTDSCFNLAIKENGVTLKTIVLKATAKPDTCTYGADGNWTEDDEHWSKMPNENTNATIEAGVDVVVSTKVSVYSLKLEEGATLMVTPTGGLTVGAGGIEGATEDNIVLQVDDDDESADFGKTGYVRVSPRHTGAMPQATIEAFSKAYKQAGDTKWQYIGSPIQEKVLAKTVFTNSYIYTWDESQGTWLNKRSSMKLEPFKGYATTQKADAKGIKLTFQGTLVEPKDTMITLYKDGANSYSGYNVLANSYSAPIDISRLQPDDFSEGVEATIHLFNTGSQAELEARTEAAVVSVTAAGQYISVPVASARVLHTLSDYPIIIPSMQGFYVKTSQAGTLTLNYERLVWNADYSKHTNEPLRIKRRAAEAEEKDEDALTGTLKVTLYTPTEVDHLIFIESEKRDAAYENGYDAHKMMSGDMNVFSVEDEEYMSVDATNSIIGTRVGVRTGSSDMYTIAFSKVNSERAMMLVDMEADKTVAIEEEAEYTFFAEPNSTITERFMIVERADVPGVATGCDNVSEGAKAHKFVKDDQMYILKNGVLYNVMGTVVK